jgi:hypothetical protein
MSDPLTRLVADLDRDGKPSLAWLTEWAPDGDLSRAWAVSGDPEALLRILGRAPTGLVRLCVRARATARRFTQGTILRAHIRALQAHVSGEDFGCVGADASVQIAAVALSLHALWSLGLRDLRAATPPRLGEVMGRWGRG